jgi:HlyD family secretion protein
MKKKRNGWAVLLVLLLLAGLGAGGWYLYQRFLAKPAVEGTAYVQQVSEIMGIGPAGMNSRYSGVVEAKNVIKVNPDKDLTIEKCYVTPGTKVSVGTPLFSYDIESLKLSHEQLQLDVIGLENKIATGEEKIITLEKKLKKAKDTKKYDIEIEIQTAELDVRKNQYELNSKKRQVQDMEKVLANSTVTSTVEGTVRSVKSDSSTVSVSGGMDDSSGNDYITIVAGNDYCIRGTVSEQTIHSLSEGMPVLVTSRIDTRTWTGTIYRINTEEPQSGNRNMYGMDTSEQAAKYDFFVELSDSSNLLMGQHVFIEPGGTERTETNQVCLPAYYLILENGKAFVYAEDANGRIEKREVSLGTYSQEEDTYVITANLTLRDRIAYPDETVQPGMTAAETAYTPEDGGDMFAEGPDFEITGLADGEEFGLNPEEPVAGEEGEIQIIGGGDE